MPCSTLNVPVLILVSMYFTVSNASYKLAVLCLSVIDVIIYPLKFLEFTVHLMLPLYFGGFYSISVAMRGGSLLSDVCLWLMC